MDSSVNSDSIDDSESELDSTIFKTAEKISEKIGLANGAVQSSVNYADNVVLQAETQTLILLIKASPVSLQQKISHPLTNNRLSINKQLIIMLSILLLRQKLHPLNRNRQANNKQPSLQVSIVIRHPLMLKE